MQLKTPVCNSSLVSSSCEKTIRQNMSIKNANVAALGRVTTMVDDAVEFFRFADKKLNRSRSFERFLAHGGRCFVKCSTKDSPV